MKTQIYKSILASVNELVRQKGHNINEKDDVLFGFSSLEFVELIVELEEKFEIEFSEQDLLADKFHTIDDLVKRIIEIKNCID